MKEIGLSLPPPLPDSVPLIYISPAAHDFYHGWLETSDPTLLTHVYDYIFGGGGGGGGGGGQGKLPPPPHIGKRDNVQKCMQGLLMNLKVANQVSSNIQSCIYI